LNGPWAVSGDFNLIMDARDKSNAHLNCRSMEMFRRCMNDLELRESHLLGRRYTWSNERALTTMVKLDRWFGSVEWSDMHIDASLSALSSSLSDHCPIPMSTVVALHVKRRFLFERFWTKLSGFRDVVVELWGSESISENPLLNLDQKLRRLARGLQRWSQQKVVSIRV
jgi:hypothetical protein